MAERPKVWQTNDGRVIPIEKMTNSHLINTYLFLERRNCIPPRLIEFYLTAPRPNGDMAQLAVEQEADIAFSKVPCIQMEWIEDEIKRRGLDVRNPGILHKLKNATYPLRKAVGLA